jgi:hypothetical protein
MLPPSQTEHRECGAAVGRPALGRGGSLDSVEASRQMVVLDAALATGEAPKNSPDDVLGTLVRVGLLDDDYRPTPAAIHYSEIIGVV